MSRVNDLQRILAVKGEDLQRFAVKGIKIDGDNVSISGEDGVAAKNLLSEIAELKTAIAIETTGAELKSFASEVSSAALAATAQRGLGAKSLGESFVASEAFLEAKNAARVDMNRPYEVEVFDLASYAGGRKDNYTGMNAANVSIGAGTVLQQEATVARAQRRNRVRDLFPVAATSSNLIEYFRVVGFAENSGKGNAGAVVEYSGGNFGSKPKSNLVYEQAQAAVRTIAHYELAHRNVMQDAPQMITTINNELLYGLSLVEDEQIIAGDGTGENLLGIVNTPGIQIFTAEASEIRSDSLRRAATLAAIANYPATGFVLHPFDWEKCELQKGDTGTSGDGQYMLVTNISVGANSQVWRQPVIETTAITEGTFLTGAFGTAAQIYDRQSANIRTSEHHSDLFIRNAMAILAEERIALTVKRPEAFVLGNFAS